MATTHNRCPNCDHADATIEAQAQQIQTLTREHGEQLRELAFESHLQDTHVPPPFERLRDHLHELWAESEQAEAEQATLRQQLAEAQQALDVLWQWASEGRIHLDSDPVPDGLGQQVIAALQGVPDPVKTKDGQ